jgi:PAS domain S-box-containing protein
MKTIDPTSLRLAAVVHSSDDAIISQGLDGTIETWNPAAERMFGYTAAQAVGRSIDLIVPPEQRVDEQQVMSHLLAERDVTHFETFALTSDGGRLNVSLSISPILSPDGQLIGLSRIARDITTQKALEAESLRLGAIIDSSEDAIVSKDLRGVVQTWNRAAERMFGYTAEEIVGRPITMIIPAERRSEEDEVLSKIRAGESIDHFETVRQRKDGSLIDISLSVSPIRTAEGVVIGASKIARDISKQRTLERASLRLAAIVDSAEDAIVSKDLNGIVQTWNGGAERMFGYTAEEMIGRSITTIIPPDRLHEEDRVLSRIRAGLGIDHFETVRQRKDGSLIEISLSVSPIRTPSGTIIGASKIARDITEQRQLARAAEEANRVKDEFLATLSHELRTPLNAVLGYTHMLRMKEFDLAVRDRAIDVIERNVHVLSQLVSDLLDVSSIVSGKVRLTFAPCDLRDILNAAVDVIRPAADTKGVTLRVQLAESRPPVQCDPDRLQQVFWNLMSNAVKFTPRGGQIHVGLATHDGTAEVKVTDTGIGIPRESLPYVFHRFWQGEGGGRQLGGLGLGLALARHFVELHGGTISVASEGEGKGATFIVLLPLGQDAPDVVSTPVLAGDL